MYLFFLEKVNIVQNFHQKDFFAQYLRDRAYQYEKCLCRVDPDDHSDLFSHDGYNQQQDGQATTPSKRAQRAYDPPDPGDEHGSLPNPIHDF
jgi:hypothetical protein